MLYGAGSLYLISKDIDTNSLRGENLIHPLSVASFELTFDTQNTEAKALIAGKKQIVAAAITEDIGTLKLTFEYVDWQTVQLAYDELASTTTSLQFPKLKSAVVALDGAASSISDAAFTSTQVVGEDVFFYVASKGTWGDRRYLTEAEVTMASGKATLAADDEFVGAVVQYTIPKTYTNIETIGVASAADGYGKLAFSGVVSGTEFGQLGMGIVVHELYRISTPQFAITGDMAEMTIEFRTGVPAGKRKAFELYKLNAA